jgi:hypothetical protein
MQKEIAAVNVPLSKGGEGDFIFLNKIIEAKIPDAK